MRRSHYRILLTLGWLSLMLICLISAKALAQVRVEPLDYRDYDLDDMGIANPGAIAYDPEHDLFFIVRAAEERPAWIFTITPHEAFVDLYTLDALSATPHNITFDSQNKRLLLYDSPTQQLLAVETDVSGAIGDADGPDTYDLSGLGIVDAQGMVISETGDYLYLLDSSTREIIEVQVEPTGNYEITVPDTERVLRVSLPVSSTAQLRGLALDNDSGYFYTLEMQSQTLFKLDKKGQVVMTLDLSILGLIDPQGFVIAPSADSTDNPLLVDLYITDSGIATEERRTPPQSTLPPISSIHRFIRRIIDLAIQAIVPTTPPPVRDRLIELYLKSIDP